MRMGLLRKRDVSGNLKQLVEICHVCEFGVFHSFGGFFCGFTSQVQLYNNAIVQYNNAVMKFSKL